MAQLVKNLPAMQETCVWSLGWEDSLEKGTATHSSILAWRIPWTVWSLASQKVGHDWATFTYRRQCLLAPECYWLGRREAICDILRRQPGLGLLRTECRKDCQESIPTAKTFPWQHIPVSGDSLMTTLCPWEKYRTSGPTSRYWPSFRAGTLPSTNLFMEPKGTKSSYNQSFFKPWLTSPSAFPLISETLIGYQFWQ